MTMKVRCKNCKLAFTTDDNSRVSVCSRCFSKNLEFTREESKDKPQTVHFEQPKIYTASGVIYGDTKEAWKSFHHAESKACPKCGGADFERNFKRKEKVCKKCGEIFPLARRGA